MITGIGRIKIKWKIKSKSIKARLLNHYKNFLIPKIENIDIEIKVKNDSLQIPKSAKSLLTTSSWEYLKNRNKRFFYFSRGENSSLAEVSGNFRNIKFCSEDKRGQLLLFLFPEILYSLILPEFGGILLHACGVKMGEKIFVFPALSGGGKSTLAKLALQSNIVLLNDDRIILRKVKNKYFAFGNPWHGELDATSSDSGGVGELFFLQKSRRNYIQNISDRDMFLNILRNSFYLREDKEHLKKVIEVALDMADNIKGYVLGFKPDERVWKYLDEKFR